MKKLTLLLIIVCIGVVISSCNLGKPKYDKITEFAINDLRKRVVSPSSFVVDSTEIQFSMFSSEHKNGVEKYVNIYHQSMNRFGVLLQGFTIYKILADTNGNFKVLNIENYDSEAEHDDKVIKEIMDKYH